MDTNVIEHEVVVDVPVRTAYNQWTQFEEFPRFMEGVERVEQLTDTSLRWVAEIAGVKREWTAQITRQIPDELIEWTSTEGAALSGLVRFQPIDGGRTKVSLRMEYRPDSVTTKVASAAGIVEARVRGDLERFKGFIEERGVETGGWRGEVAPPGETRELM
ncbi:MAG TPA: SRPBCC family protein [Actinomycetota bacterium]|nr:SRPBCC family protein [Actinomycetota bacterium]